MRNFRLLKPDEIEVRVASVTETGITCLLYKTARTDYALLDETVGMMGWANDYRVIDGKMYCGIGIRGDGEWVWKWNCGTESNTEAEKGQASDAMKRAGFAWGIGTELYSAPFIFIKNELLEKRMGNKVNDSFRVKSIVYDESQNICSLEIVNQRGVQVYPPQSNASRGEYKAPVTEPEKAPANSGDFVPTCRDCKKTITVKEHDFSVKYYGAPLCRDCQKKYKK